MIGIPPIKPHINSTLVSIIGSHDLFMFFHHEVRMLISADKLFLEDYFHIVGLYPIGVNDAVFVDCHICMLQIISS